VLVRDAQQLRGTAWQSQVEVFTGDVLKPETLPPAFDQVDTIYYLIHSMVNVVDYSAGDSEAAENVGRAAQAAGVKHIIYLGGLGNPQSELSTHLRSRQRTGEKLRDSGVPLTEFRAGIIIGSGSASFEMIRYLTERLPIIITPRWVYTQGQPIAIDDVLDYLVQSLSNRMSIGKIIEIGGPDILSYADMMLRYAKIRGLRRYLLPVPFLTPVLTSNVGLVTPVPVVIAIALIEGLKNEVIVQDPLATDLFPGIEPINYSEAVELALADLRPKKVDVAARSYPGKMGKDDISVSHRNLQGMITEIRQVKVNASPDSVYQIIRSLGGQNGWLYAKKLWQVRGLIDEVVGGVGLRRGRNHPTQFQVGDHLDFYRVEKFIPNQMLRLKGEMKAPGDAWMEWHVRPLENGRAILTQIAYFAPKGLLGNVYWYLLYPIHALVFSGLIRQIAANATHVH
jgi:uncharacterized protein YbjT (DUF2867 family)